ncbi:MAG: hypothetical protein M3154_10795, partial [Candidatus Eremiobacteraeota bacterium]|nr:hypothetical protein [Candidatus Eremiobacteraeota bacterium]
MHRPTPATPDSALTSSSVRPALVLLAGWLLVTAVPLLGAAAGAGVAFARMRHLVLFVATVVALALTGRTRRGRRASRSATRAITR